jgi:hypothetical protein
MDDRREIAASRFSFLLWEVGQGGNSRGRAMREDADSAPFRPHVTLLPFVQLPGRLQTCRTME